MFSIKRSGYDTVVDVQVPSGGQKRLIALARCLLRKAEVLLLDEPTENLDADQRTRLTGVIREYASDRTCLVISHDMDFIAAVADRTIVLDGRRVAEEGTPAIRPWVRRRGALPDFLEPPIGRPASL